MKDEEKSSKRAYFILHISSFILPLLLCLAATTLFTAPWIPNDRTIPGPYAPGSQFFPKLDASIWTYLLAWDAKHPEQFYDGPILLPVAHPHVANDPRLTEGLWSIPIFRALPPVTAWGVVLLIGLFTTALASWHEGSALTGSPWGGAAMMVLFGFGGFRAAHVIHVEGTFIPFLPLVVIAAVRFLEEPSRGRAILLGALIALTSIEYSYTAAPLWLALPPAIAYGAWRRGIPWTRAALPFLLGAIAIGVCLAPVAVEYFRFFRATGVARSPYEINYLSADLRSWLTGANGIFLPPFGFNASPHSDARLFPGFIALGLGASGLAALRRKSPELILFGAIGFLLSFGTMRLLFWRTGLPSLPFDTPYELLHRVLLPVKAIRAPARMGVLAHIVIAAAGAFAIARLAVTRRGAAAAAALLALAFVESRAGMRAIALDPSRANDDAYAWIAREPDSFAVVDLPMGHLYEPREELSEAASLFGTLEHGRRTPNGSIATYFSWHESIASHLAHPWTRDAVVLLRALGVRHAIARDDTAAADCASAGLKPVFVSNVGTRVFEVDSPEAPPGSPAELQERLFSEHHTHLAAVRDTLSARIVAPPMVRARAGGEYSFRVVVTNTGVETWCANGSIFGMGPAGDALISVRRWIEMPGDTQPRDMMGKPLTAAGRFPRDVAPGKSAIVLVRGLAPNRPGSYRATLDLAVSDIRWAGPADAPPGAFRLEVLPWWTMEDVGEKREGG